MSGNVYSVQFYGLKPYQIFYYQDDEMRYIQQNIFLPVLGNPQESSAM